MSAKIINGKEIAAAVHEDCRQRVERLESAYGRVPGLAVISVGDTPASASSVRTKVRACHDIGIRFEQVRYPDAVTQSDLIDTIKAYGNRTSIDGVLVQMPLPRKFDLGLVIDAIDPEKDVEGLHLYDADGLAIGCTIILPSTPHGIMRIMEHEGIVVAGRNAVVVETSNIIGKPMALTLMERDATVAVCHSKTRNLIEFTKLADILVVAAGQPKLIKKSMVREGAVVIDVGVKRLANGRLFGDCDFEGVRRKASYLTQVPGGVGPVTEMMFLAKTIDSAERALKGSAKEIRLVTAA